MTLESYAAFDTLLFDRPAEHVLRVKINNPEQMNALLRRASQQIHKVWAVIDEDPETRVTIITGEGRAFCSGGAFEGMPEGAAPDPEHQFNEMFGDARGLIARFLEHRKPVISAINGPAVGEGLAIALLADITIAATTAKLFDGHLRMGVVPGDHAALIWPLLCGLAKSKYYLMTNTPLTGQQAADCNLVSLAVPPEELEAKSIEVATRLVGVAPTALRMTKYVMNHYLRQNQAIFDLSAALEMVNFTGADTARALSALQKKEQPVFPHDSNFK
jgi:enoyl-CoA hydratase